MRIGMIGLGKMGGNMATRLTQNGHQVVGPTLEDDTVIAGFAEFGGPVRSQD